MLKKLALTAAIITAIFSSDAHARDQIRIVGSSTVYPFITVVSEEFGKSTRHKTPIVEATGTGGGLKLFCSGVDESTPDISNASRAIKQSEIELCKKNNVNEITEIKIGYDGIVLANSISSFKYNLSLMDVFLALAKEVPVGGKLVKNPYKKWSDINSSLPNEKIAVYGPPPTSGTRDAFIELAMEKPCKGLKEFKAAYPDKKTRKKKCHLMREDGAFVETGENDNLIIQKLIANPDALGIFGFSFLDQNSESVQGSIIDGVSPDFENISSGDYSISRPLFVYAKNAHFDKIVGMKGFLKELVSEKAIGEDGYLAFKGLITLSEDDRQKMESDILKSIGE